MEHGLDERQPRFFCHRPPSIAATATIKLHFPSCMLSANISYYPSRTTKSVHGKGSLFTKMPGDDWQKFANLRLLLSYQFTHPGKKLLFMGSEMAPEKEWNFAASLDWHLLEKDERRQKFFSFCRDLIQLYRRLPALWEKDDEDYGFAWIDCHDHKNSILAYQRRANAVKETIICILNLTPLTHHNYRIGLPHAGNYQELLNTDSELYGGSNQGNQGKIIGQEHPFHNLPASATLTIPPLGALLLRADN